MRGVSRERADERVTVSVASQFAKEWKNGEWYCVSNKTCLMSHFGMTVANPQKSKLPLRFYPFFRPPIFFEKGKGKFCFLWLAVAERRRVARMSWCSCAQRRTRYSTRSVPLSLLELPHYPSVRFSFKLPRAPRVS